MIVLFGQIARQAPDPFGDGEEHFREVTVLRFGDGSDFYLGTLGKFDFGRQNHHPVFDSAFVAHSLLRSTVQCLGAFGNAFPIRKPTLAVPQQSKELLVLRGGQGNAADLDHQLPTIDHQPLVSLGSRLAIQFNVGAVNFKPSAGRCRPSLYSGAKEQVWVRGQPHYGNWCAR